MIKVRLFSIPGLAETQQVIEDLQSLSKTNPHELVVIDISKSPDLMNKYGSIAPVLLVGPYALKKKFTLQEIQVALGASADRETQSRKINEVGWETLVNRGRTVSFADRVMYWLSKHYLAFFNILLAVYIGLPFLAPVLQKEGLITPAKVIYTIYSPLCHQFAFRSYFLFGEQAYYPRELAGIQDVITYEKIAPDPLYNIDYARTFTGNETLGYKVALCERDIAIYGSMLVFGLIFAFTGRKLKRIHWLILGLVGILPIGLDGFTQIPGILASNFPTGFLLRESTPLLRTITGSLFGFLTAWFVFPLFEETMRDTREFMAEKFAVNSERE
jgi:uncharacterized membrane protein